MKQGRHGSMFPLQTREPKFTKGNYRLNFHGRVTVPSVKNFQLVSPDDKLHTVCQFGKVLYVQNVFVLVFCIACYRSVPPNAAVG